VLSASSRMARPSPQTRPAYDLRSISSIRVVGKPLVLLRRFAEGRLARVAFALVSNPQNRFSEVRPMQDTYLTGSGDRRLCRDPGARRRVCPTRFHRTGPRPRDNALAGLEARPARGPQVSATASVAAASGAWQSADGRRNRQPPQISGAGSGSGLVAAGATRRPRTACRPAPLPCRPCGVPDGPALPEKDVVAVAGAASPAARVAAAVAALGDEWVDGGAIAAASADGSPRRRPGILDYHSAYLAGARGSGCRPKQGGGGAGVRAQTLAWAERRQLRLPRGAQQPSLPLRLHRRHRDPRGRGRGHRGVPRL
jgi:hypothetical protein